MSEITPNASSIFMDSGAFSLYTRNILKKQKAMGKHGRELDAESVSIADRDLSFYTLEQGSEFRAYCDRYARFMRKTKGRVLLANVDCIYDPEITWKVQQFFEQEYGLQPVPIVHYKTPLKWVDRYLETGRYDLMGVGGFAWGSAGSIEWLDEFFCHICPESNKYLPLIRVHGFALTSWATITRWPWWSVDSTSWFMTAGHGGIYMPRWSESKGWRFDRSPHILQISEKSPSRKDRGRHYFSLTEAEKRNVKRWLERVGVSLKDVSGTMEQDSSYVARSLVNLTYFKDLEESRPEWPHPLDTKKVKSQVIIHRRGFGL